MHQSCVDRLVQLGYTPTEADENALLFDIEKALSYIKIQCNRSDIPNGCEPFIVDYVCGTFLLERKNMGLLPVEFFDYEAPVKEIREGDTTVKLAGSSDGQRTAEERFDKAVNQLIRGLDKYVVAPNRKLPW